MPEHRFAFATGASLLTTLDTVLPRNPLAADGRISGIAAATSLNALLMRHKLGWGEVITSSNRLAKLCGALGSDFEAERVAAYEHAVRLIIRSTSTWSLMVHLPSALQDASLSRNLTYFRMAIPVRVPEAVSSLFLPLGVSPPEDDWITTVHCLRERRAWRSQEERALLDALESSLANGHALDDQVLRRICDIWWHAELNNVDPGFR